MITAGFSLPGFDGALRAFRTYKPVADSTKPTGWKFVNDGTRLWPDLDGRPSLAGTGADAGRIPNTRNIYTYMPERLRRRLDRGVHHRQRARSLAPHMGVRHDDRRLITFVRAQPLGAVIGSTPAFMDAPSLDPPPDDDYGRARLRPGRSPATTRTGARMIFFGANDGMIHAVDARTGYEVWAFIPYNLLPKLRDAARRPAGRAVRLLRRQLAEDRRSQDRAARGAALLIIGQGPGGTFYQAFDVTEAGMGVAPDADGLSRGQRAARAVRHAGRVDQVQVGVPELLELRSDLHRDVHRHATARRAARSSSIGDLKSTAHLRREDRRLHLVGPRRRSADADRSTNAVIVGSGYFPGHRGTDSRPRRRRAQGRQRDVSDQRRHREC